MYIIKKENTYMNMHAKILNAVLSGTILLTGASFSLKACAQDMPYEPVFENVPITESINTAATTEATQPKTSAMTPVEHIASSNTSTATTAASTSATATSAESSSLQNALMQLDSAQVDLRNQLIQYKNEYTDLDNQYQSLAKQRSDKAKLIKETEKKIKNLDSTKEKIRKNMN